MSDREAFFAALDRAQSGRADAAEAVETEASSTSGEGVTAATETEEARRETPPFDPSTLVERTAERVAGSVAAALAEAERRREGRQSRPVAEPPKEDPFPEPDSDRLLADEKYHREYLERVVQWSDKRVNAALGKAGERLQAIEQAVGSMYPAVASSQMERAFNTAADAAVANGLVKSRAEFDSLGEDIGRVMKAEVDAGRWDDGVRFNPQAILMAADHAVNKLGVKPKARRAAPPPEHSIGTGDEGGRRREPKVNGEVWSDVQRRLGHLLKDGVVRDDKKKLHAALTARRAS